MCFYLSQRKEKRKAILIYIFYQVTEECFQDLRLEEIIKSYSLKNKASLYHFCLRTEVIWDSLFIRHRNSWFWVGIYTKKPSSSPWLITDISDDACCVWAWPLSPTTHCSLGNTDEKELAWAMRPISQPINSWKEA